MSRTSRPLPPPISTSFRNIHAAGFPSAHLANENPFDSNRFSPMQPTAASSSPIDIPLKTRHVNNQSQLYHPSVQWHQKQQNWPATPSAATPKPFVLTVAEKFLSKHTLNPAFLAQYTLTEELGSGGFGFVCSATRKSDQMEVAVKFIIKARVRPQGWAKDTTFGVIPLECYFIKKIKHPNIISFIDYFEDATFSYLITELHGSPWMKAKENNSSQQKPPEIIIPKQPLNQIPASPPPSPSVAALKRHFSRRSSCDLFECIEQHERFSEDQARLVFTQIASAIHFLHSNGVVHRDIKDENILVDKNFQVKLIDFGAASFIPTNDIALFDSFLGTVQYASPEIFKREKYRGPEAEVWSLACCLYIMLTGQIPFETKMHTLRSPFAPVKFPISPECRHLLEWMLQKVPSERPSINQILQHPWVRQGKRGFHLG